MEVRLNGGPEKESLSTYVPSEIAALDQDLSCIPRIAKDKRQINLIEEALHQIPCNHGIYLRDSRDLSILETESVHLVVTSPPYWTLKDYEPNESQLGHFADYDRFHAELNRVWRECYRLLVPGGRLICVVGDVCLSRRQNSGRHTVVPLHATIQENCRAIGYDNLAPIIWHKISNAKYEVEGGSSFLGKPYEPNAVIKNDIEFILMLRKPGGYRTPEWSAKLLSVISAENYQKWFQQIWSGVTGASTKEHPAPYPLELAERLVRMFSFVGDTVLDPFMGTGTTNLASARWGRNSVGCELEKKYFSIAQSRLEAEFFGFISNQNLNVYAV